MTGSAIAFWPPIPPSAYLRRPAAPLPFPFDRTACRLYGMGRHALWQGVRSLPLDPGDQVLVPAYHHGSEVEALVRAGLSSRFYEAQDDLAPDAAELQRLLTPRVKALYLIHYLGFPQDARRWRSWCDERGLLLFEDAAMAWPGTAAGHPLGSHGDLTIFSPWKAVGLPETGALLMRGQPPPPPSRRGRVAPRALLDSHRAWLARRLPVLGKDPPRGGCFDARDFALGDPWVRPAGLSAWLLRRLYAPEIVVRRRVNFTWLLERFGDRVPPPFTELPPGTFPMAFPIVAADRSGLRATLADRGIEAVELWAHPHPSLPVELFPGAAKRRSTCLALPVHQGLGRNELEAIARAVAAAQTPPQPREEARSAATLPAAMPS
jgi:dTDP-4-amino-4,6-dideoxygalactose transaminase